MSYQTRTLLSRDEERTRFGSSTVVAILVTQLLWPLRVPRERQRFRHDWLFWAALFDILYLAWCIVVVATSRYRYHGFTLLITCYFHAHVQTVLRYTGAITMGPVLTIVVCVAVYHGQVRTGTGRLYTFNRCGCGCGCECPQKILKW